MNVAPGVELDPHQPGLTQIFGASHPLPCPAPNPPPPTPSSLPSSPPPLSSMQPLSLLLQRNIWCTILRRFAHSCCAFMSIPAMKLCHHVSSIVIVCHHVSSCVIVYHLRRTACAPCDAFLFLMCMLQALLFSWCCLCSQAGQTISTGHWVLHVKMLGQTLWVYKSLSTSPVTFTQNASMQCCLYQKMATPYRKV